MQGQLHRTMIDVSEPDATNRRVSALASSYRDQLHERVWVRVQEACLKGNGVTGTDQVERSFCLENILTVPPRVSFLSNSTTE